ncbi:MAG: oxidoreductase, partial [Spirochaetota bacterium]
MAAEESARAVYFVSPGRVEARTIPLKPPRNSVGVSSRLCGVSHGTEGLFFRGEAPRNAPGETLSALRGELSYPVKYGYMNVGVTDAGERVFAFYPHQDRFYLPPEELKPLPDTLSFEDAVLLPTVETAVGIVHDLGPYLGEVILVTGLG